MSNDKLESLKQRAAARLEAASQRLNQNLGGTLSNGGLQAPPTFSTASDQASLQAASALFSEATETAPIGALAGLGTDGAATKEQPPAPTGKWRCVVDSNYVSIDLTADIAEAGSLSAQGSIVYKGTTKIYEVSGQGDWTALPPDPSSPNWIFKFRLQPSNHAIFSWFARPTSSPNHLTNRFVVPNNGGVVETNCERIG